MLLDLHVHTSRYSPCGRSSPEEMVEAAREAGLHGLVFTEHNVLWPREELAELQKMYPEVKLYRGVEITSCSKNDYLLYGLADGANDLPVGLEDVEIIQWARRQNAAIVLAHPYRYVPEVPDALSAHPVDAIEVMSTNIYNYAHRPAIALAHRLGIPAICASDGHHGSMLGLYAMVCEDLPANERALAQRLRAGAMQPYIDAARITEQNRALAAEIPAILELIQRGMSDAEIREHLATYVSLTVIEGLRQGKDILRPCQPALPFPSLIRVP